MKTQRQPPLLRLPRAGLLLIGLVALTAVFMGHDVARAEFTPQFTLALSTQEPGANPEISTSLNIAAPQPNFGGLVAFTPAEFTVPKASDMPIGAVVAELTSDAILGLINGACATPIRVEFTFFNASVDINDTIDPLPLTLSDNLQNLAQDKDPQNFIPDGAERYPSYLKDPDVFGNTQPRARYFGSTFIPSASTTVILNFVFFDPGVTPNPEVPLDPRLGYPNVTVLQDPTVVAPGLITDFCTPLVANTTVFAISKNNPNTGTGGGHVVRQNPTSDGTFNFLNWARSQRDADGDGLENTLDTCPFHTNVEDPRLTPGQGGDPDLDAIDSACDPGDGFCDLGPGVSHLTPTDCDGDGFLNRGDNCPQIANGLDQDAQADADDDGIGDACDTPGTDPGIPGVPPRTVAGQGPTVADGTRTDICTAIPVTIGAGGPAPSGTIPVGATTCPPTSVAAVERVTEKEEEEEDLEEVLLATLAPGLNPLAVSSQTAIPGGSITVFAAFGDDDGNPLSGVDVTFKIEKQPGSDASLVFAGMPGRRPPSDADAVAANLEGETEVTKTTDAKGIAKTTLNVGSKLGTIEISATATDPATGQEQKKTITVTVAEAGPATGVGSLAPAIASIPAWAAAASALGGAGLLASLGALASRVLRRRRQ